MKGKKSSIASRFRAEWRWAKRLWPEATSDALRRQLEYLVSNHGVSVVQGDLAIINKRWYVTHSGLLGIARRSCCHGIETHAIPDFCDTRIGRWAFRATVFSNKSSRGFVGYGDADPFSVSSPVRGAEMRVAETRAVNRALRKAYGIGICSVEEIGSFERSSSSERSVRKLPPESSNGNGHGGNGNGTRVRDRLCQIIRQHKLDAEQVKSYAVDFCRAKTLREASREQVENFVAHLADWAARDRNALLCQLNTYVQQKAGAA